MTTIAPKIKPFDRVGRKSVMRLRATPDEIARVKAEAQASGLSLSDYIRSQLRLIPLDNVATR